MAACHYCNIRAWGLLNRVQGSPGTVALGGESRVV